MAASTNNQPLQQPTIPSKPKVSLQSWLIALASLSVLFYTLMNLFATRPIGFDFINRHGEHVNIMLTNAGLLLIVPVLLIQNVITEIWGKNTAFRITIFAIACQLFVVAISQVVILLPTNNAAAADTWANLFGSQWRIATASITAFFVGSMLNIIIFDKIRKNSKSNCGKFKWLYVLAAIISTIIAQFIDSFLFMTLAFAPIGLPTFELSWPNILTSIAIGTSIQILLEATLVALIVVHIVAYIKKTHLQTGHDPIKQTDEKKDKKPDVRHNGNQNGQ